LSRLDQQASWWDAPLFRNDQLIERPTDQSTLTSRYTQEALNFIHEHHHGPFFIYLAHTFPHVPLFASPRFKGKSPRGLYGDVVEEIDDSVGQIMAALRREKLDGKTFVFFTSDNGPWLNKAGRVARQGFCAKAKDRPGKGACASPASRGGPAMFQPVLSLRNWPVPWTY